MVGTVDGKSQNMAGPEVKAVCNTVYQVNHAMRLHSYKKQEKRASGIQFPRVVRDMPIPTQVKQQKIQVRQIIKSKHFFQNKSSKISVFSQLKITPYLYGVMCNTSCVQPALLYQRCNQRCSQRCGQRCCTGLCEMQIENEQCKTQVPAYPLFLRCLRCYFYITETNIDLSPMA